MISIRYNLAAQMKGALKTLIEQLREAELLCPRGGGLVGGQMAFQAKEDGALCSGIPQAAVNPPGSRAREPSCVKDLLR